MSREKTMDEKLAEVAQQIYKEYENNLQRYFEEITKKSVSSEPSREIDVEVFRRIVNAPTRVP